MTIGGGQIGASNQGGIDVNIQSQTAPYFKYFLINEQKTDILLTLDISKDDEIVNVSSGHGFTGDPGEFIVVWENNKYFQMEVVLVAANAITVSHPIANIFTTDRAQVIRGNNLLNVDASTTPVNFEMIIRDFTIPIDISWIVLTMFHSTAGDDGKFGGIGELAKGIWFRKEDGLDFNLGNYRNNQDFKNVAAKVEYTDKGPAGDNATNISFDLDNIFKNQMRIKSAENDIFRGQARDNMLIGMSSFTISLVGSYTVGEE